MTRCGESWDLGGTIHHVNGSQGIPEQPCWPQDYPLLGSGRKLGFRHCGMPIISHSVPSFRCVIIFLCVIVSMLV